jgi:hypothetical protein
MWETNKKYPVDLDNEEHTIIGVAMSLHLDMSNLWRRLEMYHRYERSKPSIVKETLIPRK